MLFRKLILFSLASKTRTQSPPLRKNHQACILMSLVKVICVKFDVI